MGGLCQSDTTVSQTQTYKPAKAAGTAITGALNQGQAVAQTPFQTPQAPVAGFSQDQYNAFQDVRNAQGQAQPYLDQAQDYFAGQHVNDFLNPYAANVMAGLKDVFGQQMSQATGKYTQQAGGVGADRIGVAQANLANQQGLAAGQTLAGLYQPALQASQNAGFGIGSLGPVAQNAALQGAQAQLGTGGLQQQLQQAQMNSPYQQELARIQWPYQNAQFNAGITASLAPGLGGTTSGQTTYPQPSMFGQIAGLGMVGAGAYGASGGQYGLGSTIGNAYSGMTGFNPAGIAQGPSYAARGGRMNPYADGGVVGYAEGGETDDSMDDQIQAAEIQQLRDAGNMSNVGISAPQSGVAPINIAPQSLVPDAGQLPKIAPHIPQLQAPQQQSGGGGGLMGLAGTALKVLPFLNQGGAVNGYAEGGETKKPSYYESFLKALRGINDAIAPTPQTGSIGGDLMAALPFASAALRPSGIRLRPTNTTNPQQQIRGRFTAHGDSPRWTHPGVMNSPLVAGAAASQFLPEDSAPQIEPPHQDDAGLMAGAGKGGDEGNPFADRWGEMAPPSAEPRQDPLFLQSGMQDAPPRAMPENVPLPRSNPFVPMALNYERKKRAAVAPPANPYVPERMPPYRAAHMAEGGEVEDEFAPEPFTRRQAALEAADPFERAALRTRESVRPTTGRQEGPLMGAAGTALAIAGSPEAMLASYAPRVGAALYGLGAGTAPTEAGEPEFKWSDPNQERAKRLGDIDAAIALESERKTKSAPGTQKARIDSLAKEKEALLSSRGGDYNMARQAWQDKQEADRLAAIEKKKAETSLFDMVPGTRAALTAASPAASFLGGKFLGKRVSPWAAVPIGATTGAIEGFGSIAGPTEVDINSLPRSSATRQEAEADLDKKSYWQRVALASGVSGAAGALGAIKGYASTKPVRTPSKTGPSVSEAAQEAVKASAPRMKIPVTLSDGSTVFKYPGGRFHNGKSWIKAPDIAKAKEGKPLPYTKGGAVNPFADGGKAKGDTLLTPYDLAGPGTSEPFGGRWNALSDALPSELLKQEAQSQPLGLGGPLERPPEFAAAKDELARQMRDSTTTGSGLEDESRKGAFTPGAPEKKVFPRAEPEFDGNDPDNPFAPPQKRSDLVDNPWMALMQAGLGTMAAAGHRDAHGLPTSPLAAIGQGGMKGMEALREQQTARMKQQSVDQAAKRLQNEADRHVQAMKKHDEQLVETKRQHDFQQTKPFLGPTDERGFQPMLQYDPKSGKYVPFNPTGASPKPDARALEASADDGVIPANARLTEAGPYDYSTGAPHIEKGMDPVPPKPVGGKSARALQTDAEYYLQTGKLPPTRSGRSPIAITQQMYRDAVQNYGNATAQSRGVTPEQSAEMWRTAPGMMRFILGPDGRSTVALGTAVRHLESVKQLSEAFKTGDVQLLNRARAEISRQFGGDAATNLEAAGRIIGPEIIKALGVAGAGTTEERANAARAFSTAASPTQMAGAIDTIQKLLGGQLEGRKRQAANAGVTEERFKSLIGEAPYKALSEAESGSKTAAPALPTVNSKSDYDKLAPGTRFIGTDGKPYRKP